MIGQLQQLHSIGEMCLSGLSDAALTRHMAHIAQLKLCHLLQVFFIRDGMKFVDLNHALKPNPKTSKFAAWLSLSDSVLSSAIVLHPSDACLQLYMQHVCCYI